MNTETVIGNLSPDTIDTLYNIDLPDPRVLTAELESVMRKYNAEVNDQNSKPISFKSKYFGKENPPERVKNFYKVADFIYALRNREITFDKHVDWVGFYYKIQDIRHCLEIKCITRLTSKSSVYCGRKALLALERVIKHPEDYTNL